MKPAPSRPSPLQSRLLRQNRRQTHTLLAGVLVVIVMGLVPPWEHIFVNEIGARSTRPAGYFSIGGPPALAGHPNWAGSQIDWPVLFLEWIVAIGVTAGFVYAFRDKNPLTQKLLRRYEPS